MTARNAVDDAISSADKVGVIEVNGLTGEVNEDGRWFKEKLDKILTRDMLIEASSELAGAFVPGGGLAVKLIGAAYLVLTGLQMLLSRTKPIAEVAGQAGETSISRVFWQGALTNILNPKVALFFLAFLPQFVAADSAHKTLAFLVLGLIFITGGTLWCLGLAAFAAKAAGGIRQSAGAIGWINRSLGALFIYLGVRVAMLEAR